MLSGPSEQSAIVADPAEFQRALDLVRIGVRSCVENGVDERAIITALMAEFLPRLVTIYGPTAASAILVSLASGIAQAASNPIQRPQ